MIAFVDNDVITKLAACDLLDASLAALRLTITEVFVLGTAAFSLNVNKNRKKGEARYGVEVHGRICNFVGQAPVITGTPAPADLELLQNIAGIDGGEAVLFALCARTSDSILLTGDKRALRALAEAPGLDDIRAALRGRVYCLERVVTITINHLTFAAALPGLASGCHCDTVLKSVFGSGIKTVEKSAREALSYYETDLRNVAGGLLAPFDEQEAGDRAPVRGMNVPSEHR